MNKLILALCVAGVLVISGCSSAKDSTTNSAKASQHAAKATSHTIASAADLIVLSVKTTSVVTAIPFSIIGASGKSTGKISSEISQDLIDLATTPIGTPLKITDETITTISPEKALKKN